MHFPFSLIPSSTGVYKEVHPNKALDSNTKAQGFQHPPWVKSIFQVNNFPPQQKTNFPQQKN